MKKVLAMLLVSAAVLMLASCGGKEESKVTTAGVTLTMPSEYSTYPLVTSTEAEEKDYVLNSKNMYVHKPTCRLVKSASDPSVLKEVHGFIEDFLAEGYSKCLTCNP